MRFRQLDSITKLEPGKSIEGQRLVTGKDMYFRDHFPEFPVLPGALTTEAMVQASEWLMRKTDDFQHAGVWLKELKNVKFNGMVRPGQTLTVTSEIKKWGDASATFVTKAMADGEAVSGARMTLERFHCSERFPTRVDADAWMGPMRLRQFEALDPTRPDHQPAPITHYRWVWLDRFDEFVSGKYCKARKTVCLANEAVDLYAPYFGAYPPSLIIEGFAQAGGILASESSGFLERGMLAKVGKATFHRIAGGGDTMNFHVELVDVGEDGAMVTATSTIDGEPHVDAELMFAYIPDGLVDHDFLSPQDKAAMCQLYRVYAIGKTEEGERLQRAKLFDTVDRGNPRISRR